MELNKQKKRKKKLLGQNISMKNLLKINKMKQEIKKKILKEK